MIKKIYRLSEKEVKKVLKYGKPFFSYGIVLNIVKNNYGCNKFAIIIGGKSVLNNVSRNFFRRRFFDLVNKHIISKNSNDIVFTVKKQFKIDKKNPESINLFEKDIMFLLKKIF